jgi:hypothetical protein
MASTASEPAAAQLGYQCCFLKPGCCLPLPRQSRASTTRRCLLLRQPTPEAQKPDAACRCMASTASEPGCCLSLYEEDTRAP